MYRAHGSEARCITGEAICLLATKEGLKTHWPMNESQTPWRPTGGSRAAPAEKSRASSYDLAFS